MTVDLHEALPREIPGLLRFATTLTRDQATAEDLVQETVVRALERAASFRGESSLGTWLRRILHNLAVDAGRREREAPAGDLVAEVERRWAEDSYSVDAAEVVARAETARELEDALVHMPMVYRAAVVLHDAEELTVAQIADLQGVSLPAAKQRLRRGRMMLVSLLAEGAERRVALDGVPLRCWDARARIGDYIDGDVDQATAALLERHLATCPTCPPLYQSLVAATRAVSFTRSTLQDPDSVVPPALAARIEALLG